VVQATGDQREETAVQRDIDGKLDPKQGVGGGRGGGREDSGVSGHQMLLLY